MVFKDLELIAEAYALVVSEAKKNKRPDRDKDGVPDWADEHPGEDDKKKATKTSKEKKKKPAFLKKEGLTFKDLFNRVISEKKKAKE